MPDKTDKLSDDSFNEKFKIGKILELSKIESQQEGESLLAQLENELKSEGIKFEDVGEEEKRAVEEDLAKISISTGGHNSGKIRWDLYSELEIQAILRLHYEILGYDVNWIHRDDPSHENGIDLECLKNNGRDRILIAVKKKPDKNAIAQVVELASHAARKRIYVYVNGAAQSFRDNIKRFRGKVEFWNELKTEKRLEESELTMDLRIANTPANDAMMRITDIVLAIVRAKQPYENATINTTPEMMEIVWGMKDRAVTIHKCGVMMQLMLENETRFGEKLSHEVVDSLMLWGLDFLHAKALLSLKNSFEMMTPEFRTLLGYVNRKTFLRTNWIQIYAFRAGLKAGRVIDFVMEQEKKLGQWRELSKDEKKRGKKTKKSNNSTNSERSRQADAAYRFSAIADWGHGVEGTMDYVYERLSTGQVHG